MVRIFRRSPLSGSGRGAAGALNRDLPARLKNFALIPPLAILLLTDTIFAQDEPRKITPAEAVGIALKNNHDYKIALLKESEAKEGVNIAWGQLFPTLESEASITRQDAESGVMSMSDGQYDLKLVQAKLAVNPLLFYSKLEYAAAGSANAAEEVRRVRLKVEASAVQSYFNLLLAKEMIKLRTDSVASLKANLHDVQNLYRTGAVPKFELLQAQVQLGSAEPLLLDAKHNYTVMLESFNYVLGAESSLYTSDERVLEDQIGRIAADTVDAEVDRLTTIALTNSPLLVQVKLAGDMSKNARDAQRAYYLCPTLSVGGSWGYTKLMPNDIEMNIPGVPVQPDMSALSGNDDWQNTWQVKAAATYRWGALIPADPVRGDERRMDLQILENAESAEMLRRSIQISVRTYYSKLAASAETIYSQKENIKTAQEGLRIARESFRAGVAKNADLLASELALTNAKTGYITALNQYYTARAQLKYELGSAESEGF